MRKARLTCPICRGLHVCTDACEPEKGVHRCRPSEHRADYCGGKFVLEGKPVLGIPPTPLRGPQPAYTYDEYLRLCSDCMGPVCLILERDSNAEANVTLRQHVACRHCGQVFGRG